MKPAILPYRRGGRRFGQPLVTFSDEERHHQPERSDWNHPQGGGATAMAAATPTRVNTRPTTRACNTVLMALAARSMRANRAVRPAVDSVVAVTRRACST